ncbi:hypothetical protein PVAND_007218 [Polypedilum vanderplanki]|uniref:DnaJ homolog subfamily C member 2 n=1 Tax=Polypedilum vanderplanki TaxID=319348 RepID=A0A9J6C5K1_POLVA|nr:hypothetical protein PVAND_007218 [Polypedilum vanderplanki]
MALVLYTELKYKRINCNGVSILQYTDEINEENYPRSLPVDDPNDSVQRKQQKDEIYDGNSEVENVNVKIEFDLQYLKSLDPKNWKDQDHYAVLGLKDARFYATDDDIRRAYRKIVLKHHPDKRKGQGEEVDPDNDYFTCITRAYEILGVSQKRRSYDSVDPFFNDDLPAQSEIDKDFYEALGPCIKLNARWSEKKNVPLLGNENSDRAHVEKFYDFWYDFQSWREYSYLDEEDKEKGQDRDERRWIDKQNKQMRIKRKKEEMARIRQLVDLAYNNDPRIVKFKKEEKDKKLAAKKAKQTAVQAMKEQEELQKREEEAAKLKAEQEEQKRIEQLQKERENQKRALKKERKNLRDFAKSNNYFADNDENQRLKNIENVEKLCEALKLMDLQDLNKKLSDSTKPDDIFSQAVNEMEKQLEEERNKSVQSSYINSIGKNTSNPLTNKKALWNNDNIQLLIKAVNLFPAGTNQRWEVVANFINLHATNLPENVQFNAKEVLNKAKDIQSSDFSKNDLKSQVNKNAYESFEKNKKELKHIDNSEISQKDPGDADKGKLVNGDGKKKDVNGGNVGKFEAKESKVWTKEEQSLLEQAIKTYPVSTPDRWDRIAECVPNRNKKECLRRVKDTLYEVLVDFTKDYSLIRQALTKIEHFDKTCLHNVLFACNKQLASNWGNQCHSQIIIVTDAGIGFGKNSLKSLILNGGSSTSTNGVNAQDPNPLPLPFPSKISIMCIGNDDDIGFKYGINLYQQLLDINKQKGQLFVPKLSENKILNERAVVKMFKQMCETNYKPFEAVLNMGSYFKFESPVFLFPEPFPYVSKDTFGNETTRIISKRIEVCGYIKIADIVGSGGTPASISRHLIFARLEQTNQKKVTGELEKMESEMKHFFAKSAQDEDESSNSMSNSDVTTKESACVLLHGALKVENLAALVLLADDWYGFLYSYADKKKSNLVLSVLQPGNFTIPWMGDFRFLGLMQDGLPGESYGFPVKTEKKSYSSSTNIISWIRESALQADIQKLLRHAKKMPEKTTHFYKELNRIRRNAQSLGFNELIEVLADVFEKEAQQIQNQESSVQLRHASSELRRSDRELIKKFEG